MLEFLNERDRLCLVSFNYGATRHCPLLTVNKLNRDKLNGMINQLHANGGTSITNGMDVAFKVLKERKYINSISSIFLLTDGLDGDAYHGVQQALTSRKMEDAVFSISCFGFGSDHDATLMTNIAKLRKG